MVDRLAAVVGQQILLADIGDVGAFLILGEQVIEGLVLGRAQLLGDRLIPFLAELAKTGSMSKITPRKSNMRWRTTSPIEKRAWATGRSLDRGWRYCPVASFPISRAREGRLQASLLGKRRTLG